MKHGWAKPGKASFGKARILVVRPITASEIVQDKTIYPRERVDPSHVDAIAAVIEAGGELPPLVVDRKSRRLIDGFHRLNAYIKLFGVDTEVVCIEKDYDSLKEMWLDSIRYNAKHGLPLSARDKEHCRLTCKSLKMKAGDAAAALGIKPAAFGFITSGAASRPAGKPAPLTTINLGRCPGCGAKLADGFKKCLKCKPNQSSTSPALVGGSLAQETPADGWEDRLSAMRAGKESGNEFLFHVDWLVNYFHETPMDITRRESERLKELWELIDRCVGRKAKSA